jgi:hypothetical protein
MPAPIVPAAVAAVSRLVAKHGMSQVQRALKAANKPAKGSKASKARGRGADYQGRRDTLLVPPGSKAESAIKTRNAIKKARGGK